MNIQTGYERDRRADACARTDAATNFTVLRVKRDILRRSTIGAIFTNRSIRPPSAGARTRPTASTARSRSTRTSPPAPTTRAPSAEGLTATNDSYQGSVDYVRRPLRRARRVPEGRRELQSRDRLRAADRLREDLRPLRFSPRPRSIKVGAQVHLLEGALEYFVNAQRHGRDRRRPARFTTEFQNSDQFVGGGSTTTTSCCSAVHRRRRASLIPAGGYNFNDVTHRYALRAAAAHLRHGRAAGRASSTTAHHGADRQQRPRVRC